MLHVVARALPGRLLFRSWPEALVLWRAIVALPGLRAAVLMPNHIHALTETDVLATLGTAMSGHARFLNPRRGRRGPLWEPAPHPQPVLGAQKIRRNERYIHLNPCRAGLVVDPLAWPFSTHRDRVGLAWPAAVDRAGDVVRYHRYVSSDPTVRPGGTELPVQGPGEVSLGDVEAAVSALCRAPVPLLRQRSPARDLALRAARCLVDASAGEIADWFGVTRRTVFRNPIRRDAGTALVARVVGDGRFAPLSPGDLRADWWPYRDFD